MSLSERQERGLKLLQEMLGAEQAEKTLQHWQEICPDFEGYVTEFLSGRSGVVPDWTAARRVWSRSPRRQP